MNKQILVNSSIKKYIYGANLGGKLIIYLIYFDQLSSISNLFLNALYSSINILINFKTVH